MPYRDGTGPNGQGAATGRELGSCTNSRPRLGLGFGMGCGRGRGRIFAPTATQTNQSLVAEKESLEKRLEAIKKQLEK